MNDYPTNPTIAWDRALELAEDLADLYTDPTEAPQ